MMARPWPTNGERAFSPARAARVRRAQNLEISTKLTEAGFGACVPTFVVYDDFARVVVDGQTLTDRSDGAPGIISGDER